MDPNKRSNEAHNYKLPEVQVEESIAKPKVETGDSTNVTEASMSRAIEQSTIKIPSGTLNSQQPSQGVAVDPSSSLLGLNQPTQSKGQRQIKVITDDLPADDIDLIEKAWVVKAKAIVNETKGNPNEQSSEIEKIRNDYQSKRFNKANLDQK